MLKVPTMPNSEKRVRCVVPIPGGETLESDITRIEIAEFSDPDSGLGERQKDSLVEWMSNATTDCCNLLDARDASVLYSRRGLLTPSTFSMGLSVTDSTKCHQIAWLLGTALGNGNDVVDTEIARCSAVPAAAIVSLKNLFS